MSAGSGHGCFRQPLGVGRGRPVGLATRPIACVGSPRAGADARLRVRLRLDAHGRARRVRVSARLRAVEPDRLSWFGSRGVRVRWRGGEGRPAARRPVGSIARSRPRDPPSTRPVTAGRRRPCSPREFLRPGGRAQGDNPAAGGWRPTCRRWEAPTDPHPCSREVPRSRS